MKKTRVPLTLPFARVLAGSVAAAAIALGCGTEPSGDAPAPPSATEAGPDASGAADLSYQSLIALLGDPDGFARARKLGELLPKVGPRSLRPVKMILKHTSRAQIELGAADYELLLRYWALHDPEGASSYAFGASPRGYRVSAIHATVRHWAKLDPLGALAKIRTWMRQEGDFGAATQIAFVRGWYDSGKHADLEAYLHDLGPNFERQRGISAFLVEMAHERGGDAVASWAEAQMERGDDSYRLDVFRGAGNALMAVDVAAAQRFCDTHCDEPHGNKLRTSIATRWVEVGEPRDVFAWLAKAPQNGETEVAVRRSFAIWADLDRAAALSWIKPVLADESATWVHAALPLYVTLLGRENPTEALAVAERFFTGEDRDFSMVEVLRFWRQTDEAAAEAWLAKSSLAAEILAKVREPQTDYERLIIRQEGERRELQANQRRLES